jgi:UDP-glucose 4-epimerase
MSTVAVTGCSGYIGRNVCELLDKDESVSRVVGVDLRDPAFSTRNLEFYRLDVRSPDLADVIAGCDAVIHLAAAGGHDARDTIVGGMNSVTRAAGEAGVKKLVFTSTTLVYGGAAPTEDSAVRPAPGYAAANAEAEEAARAFAFEHRDAVLTVLRLASVSGPRVPAASIAPAAGEVLHEDDAARAVMHALNNVLPGTFNVPGQRFADTGFALEHTSSEALRQGAEAHRGWVTVGGMRVRPSWVAAAAGSIAALAIGSAARAVSRRAKS